MTLDDILVYDEDNTSVCDNSDTEDYIKKYFVDKTVIGKKDLSYHSEKRTLLNNKLRAMDKIIEVLVINAESAVSARFISVTFRIIAEREIKQISKKYVQFGESSRYPKLIERKYLEQKKYKEFREKLYTQMK